MAQQAPPDYREVTGSQSTSGPVPGPPGMVSYQTAAGPIYVS